MTKAQKIVEHIQKSNGLTNPVIAHWSVGCSVKYAEKIFKYLIETGNVEKETRPSGNRYYYIGL